MTTENHLFSATISHLDYAGLVFVYFADFATGQFSEVTRLLPLGQGCQLDNVVAADASYTGRGLQVAMRQTKGGVNLTVEVADFEGRPLTAQFTITTPPEHETLNVVVPWNARTFQFTSKQNCLPSEGLVTIGDQRTVFSGTQSFACLDFGRGIWPRHCRWNWGSASGRQNGHLLGLNLGGQWTDNTGSTENGVCLDGRLHKYSTELTWQYDKHNFMCPWHITDPYGQLDLTFTPFLERVATSNVWLVNSEVHQLFGRYSGHVTTTEGEVVPVADLVGWAEDHVALW